MKKTVIYLLLLIVLAAVAIWLIQEKNTTGTLDLKDEERYAFTIKDTAGIDKIVLRDKTPREVTLTRNANGGWTVNGSAKARKDAIGTLLETLYRMEMRNFIPEKMQQTVIKRMAVYGKEVQIYKDGKLFKTIYVGTEAQDEMATYMMIKGSDQPFAVYIPGFNGFLSTRFFTKDYLWKSREIFNKTPADIQEVEVYYPDSAASSFVLHVKNGDVNITGLKDEDPVGEQDKIHVNLFLNAFKDLSYEGPIIPEDPIYAKRDSLLASVPVFKIKLTDIHGNSTTLSGYKIPSPESFLDPDAAELTWDRDRMHGFVNNDHMVLLQYYALRHVLKPKSYFSKS